MSAVELLSPAGTLAKGLTALHFGADAVYCGLPGFNLRRQAEGVSVAELTHLVDTAHVRGRKVYLAANIFPTDDDWHALRLGLKEIGHVGVDAVIVSDPGVLDLVGELLPGTDIHLSTQANTLSSAAAAFWFRQGVRRIILARELSIAQIRRLCRAVPDGELEVFIHGAQCMAYSGRCFLSTYLAGRDANQGECAHSCRWRYRVTEESRQGEWYEVDEGPDYTRIFSSRDLWALPVLPELVTAGPRALKIEGRMKSVYYTAVTTAVYRQALDSLQHAPRTWPVMKSKWEEELCRLPNRGYTTGFLTGATDLTEIANMLPPDGESAVFCGLFGERQADGVELHVKNTFDRRERLEVFRPDGLRTVRLETIRNHRGEWTEKAHSGLTVWVRPDIPVASGDLLRRTVGGKK